MEVLSGNVLDPLIVLVFVRLGGVGGFFLVLLVLVAGNIYFLRRSLAFMFLSRRPGLFPSGYLLFGMFT